MAAATDPPRILYCRCAYAQVVPQDVKDSVLRHLTSGGRAFDAVSDLCGMSAARDPRLKEIASGGPVKIAACHRRAVLWLFHAAGSPLPEDAAEVVNMRRLDPAAAAERLDSPGLDTTAP